MARTVLITIAVCFLLTAAMTPVAWSHPAQYLSQGDSSLQFSVSVEKRFYLAGEAIRVRLVLINPTLSEIHLGFGGGHWIDYEILSNDAVLYRWSDDKAFHCMVWTLTMAPLEVKDCSFVHEDSDYPLSPGAYQVRGLVVNRAEGYASLVVVDVLPGLVLRAFSVTLGTGLVVILVSVTGYTLTKRPALKRRRPWRKSPKGA